MELDPDSLGNMLSEREKVSMIVIENIFFKSKLDKLKLSRYL